MFIDFLLKKRLYKNPSVISSFHLWKMWWMKQWWECKIYHLQYVIDGFVLSHKLAHYDAAIGVYLKQPFYK